MCFSTRPGILNGFSLGLFKAKTALRRQRLQRISTLPPRRRRNIAGTSGRASSSPSPTRPASGAPPPSRAQPPTSSCLASSRGKSECSPSLALGLLPLLLLSSSFTQHPGMCLGCLPLSRLWRPSDAQSPKPNAQQNPCSGELPFWWEIQTIKEKAREYILCWRDPL